MLSPELVQLAAMALAGLAIGGGVYVLVLPYFSGERKAEKRMANVAQGQTRALRRPTVQPLQTRRQQVQDSIKNIEAKQKANKRVPLRIKLIRAGLSITPRTYYILSLLTGVLGGLIVLITGSSLIVSVLVAFACGFGLPRWVVSRMTKRRQAKFLIEFANAIDIIVRGIKSGLPISDCLQIIATEMPEPVKGEFIDLVEQQKIGVPLSRAFERMYERMPLQEVNFFAIVIAIQAQTGGNLAEALNNLSQVLRDRYRLAGQGEGVQRRGQGVGYDHRRAAADRHAARVPHLARLHHAAVDRASRQSHAHRRWSLDADWHPGHAQDDQFRLLGPPCTH